MIKKQEFLLFSYFDSSVCDKKVGFYDCLIHISVWTHVPHWEEIDNVFAWRYEVLF